MMTWFSLFLQSPSSSMLETVILMHDYVMMFLMSILSSIIYFFFKMFKEKNYSFEFSENNQLELIWTMVPFFMLAFIAIPSILSLYYLDSCSFCGITINIMAHQWYWSYFYKNFIDLSMDSYMESSSNFLRNTEVDNRLVIPTNIPVRMNLSSADVIHSWTIPSMGVKMDAVPGRINQFCFSSKHSGIYFGQCSEICGANHSFMPIVMESVPFKKFLKMY